MGLVGYNLMNTEPLQAITGRKYRGDGTTRLVLWSHGHQSVANRPELQAWSNIEGEPTFLLALTNMGLPVICPACAGDNWGNDAGQQALSDARSWGSSGFLNAKIDKVVLVGLSMGGLLSLNWARTNPTLVSAIVLLYPAVNLQALHDGSNGSVSFLTQTEAAYGGSTASFNSSVTAHDPSQNAGAWASIPVKMWYSDNDATVGSLTQTNFLSANPSIQSTILPGAQHADLSKVDVNAFSQFVKAHL